MNKLKRQWAGHIARRTSRQRTTVLNESKNVDKLHDAVWEGRRTCHFEGCGKSDGEDFQQGTSSGWRWWWMLLNNIPMSYVKYVFHIQLFNSRRVIKVTESFLIPVNPSNIRESETTCGLYPRAFQICTTRKLEIKKIFPGNYGCLGVLRYNTVIMVYKLGSKEWDWYIVQDIPEMHVSYKTIRQ